MCSQNLAIKKGVKVKMMVSDHASRVDLMKKHLRSLMTSLNKQQIDPVFEAKLFDVTTYLPNLIF